MSLRQNSATRLNHTGQPLDEDRTFSQSAPHEIGPVLSQFSTSRPGEGHAFVRRSIFRAMAFSLPLLGGIGALLIAGPDRLGGSSDGLWTLVGLCGGLFSLLGLLSLRRHECTYVGEKGIARFIAPGPGLSSKTNPVFSFEQARVLYTATTRHYHNGIYGGTEASYHWVDADGKPVYTINTRYYSYKETPGPEETIQFCRAAERAWTAWVVQKHREELERLGKTGFPLRSRGAVFLTRNGLMVQQGQKETEFPRDSLTGLSLQKGLFALHRSDDKGGLFGKGPFTLAYAQLGNAQALLLLASQQLHLPILG